MGPDGSRPVELATVKGLGRVSEGSDGEGSRKGLKLRLSVKKVRFFRLWFYMGWCPMVPGRERSGPASASLARFLLPRRYRGRSSQGGSDVASTDCEPGAVRPIRAESPSLADVPRAVYPTEEVSR